MQAAWKQYIVGLVVVVDSRGSAALGSSSSVASRSTIAVVVESRQGVAVVAVVADVAAVSGESGSSCSKCCIRFDW